MALSDGEKIIIAMLADQAKAQSAKGELDTEFIANNAHSKMWAVKAMYPGIFGEGDDENPDQVRWTHDALSMWLRIESGYQALSPEDKDRVKAARGSHGQEPRFRGFDGHSDHASIAGTMIRDLGYYEEFADRSLDSHMPDIEVHDRLLRKFKELQQRAGGLWNELTADELIEILDESIHPENR